MCLNIFYKVRQDYPELAHLNVYIEKAEADRAYELAGEFYGIIKQAGLDFQLMIAMMCSHIA